jgi:lactoylglutathione lyase
MMPVHHMLHVRDLKRAVRFYEHALGLVVADRHQYDGASLVYLRVPGTSFEIELIAPDHWPYALTPEAGRLHLAFAVADLDAEHARLQAIGVKPDPIADYVANGAHQTRYFYFCDPEGNQIEFLEPCGRYALEKQLKECEHVEHRQQAGRRGLHGRRGR